MATFRRISVCAVVLIGMFPVLGIDSVGAFGPDEFRPVAPRRIMDTRVGKGAPAAKVGPGQTVNLQVAGVDGIPSTGIAAVSVNITVTGATESSYLKVWPTGGAVPGTSIINMRAGQTIANATVVALQSGQLSLKNASGETHIIVDVSGWFPDGSYRPAGPTRVADTRTGTGVPAVKVGPGQTITVQLEGVTPALENLTSFVVNLTATAPTANGYLTVWPAGQPRPTASTLNFKAAQTIANATITGASSTGRVSIYNSSGDTHVVLDVYGGFQQSDGFVSVTPARVLDTRSGNGVPAVKVGAGQVVTVQITGRGGIPSTGVSAVAVNVTATGPTASSYLTAWPAGQTRPTASILNFGANTTIANSSIVGLSQTGQLSIYNNAGDTDVIADVSGWFQTVPTVATDIAVGTAHACAVTSAGGVECWGSNSVGRLGDGTVVDRETPVPVPGLTGIVQVAAGARHTCALSSAGSVRCWGANQFGQVGVSGSGDPVLSPVLVSGVIGATQISLSDTSVCALIYTGGVRCWGHNSDGALGDGTWDSRSTPAFVSGISTATQISAGNTHSCALLDDGSVKCWGTNSFGELGDGTTTDRNVPVAVVGLPSSIVRIESGKHFGCALLTSGFVRCWGDNDFGQLGDGTRTDRPSPVVVTGLANVAEVSAGHYHSCARTYTDQVKCWGNNSWGGLGDGTLLDSATPVDVAGLVGATRLATGYDHTCAIYAVGSVSCWGENMRGQLGVGESIEFSTVPTTVFGF